MVSLFGLKIGGAKKSQSKDTSKSQRNEQKNLDQGASRKLNDDLPAPRFPGFGNRPSSSRSNYNGNNVMWNAPYAGPVGATSLVDLSMPAPGRKDSFSSLRPPNLTKNSLTRLGNGSSSSLALPPTPNVMPGTPTRPATSARSKEWVNPLDVHFSRDSASATRPGTRSGVVEKNSRADSEATPAGPGLGSGRRPSAYSLRRETTNGSSSSTADGRTQTTGHADPFVRDAQATPPQANTALSQFEFGIRALEKSSTMDSTATASSITTVSTSASTATYHTQATNVFSGPPSPPKSVSPTSVKESATADMKTGGLSSLRHVDSAGSRASSPPSPKSTSSGVMSPRVGGRISDDEHQGMDWQVPVIREVHAKRDTLTMHSAKRQSVEMELQSEERVKEGSNVDDSRRPSTRGREQDYSSGWRPRKSEQPEGLNCNFGAFDFGESVRGSTISRQKSDSLKGSLGDDSKARSDASETRMARSESTPDRPRQASIDRARAALAARPHEESPIEPRKREMWSKETTQQRLMKPRPPPSKPLPSPAASPRPPVPLKTPRQDHAPMPGPTSAPRQHIGLSADSGTEADRPNFDRRPSVGDEAPRGFASRPTADSNPRIRAPVVQPLLIRRATADQSQPRSAPQPIPARELQDEDDGALPTPEDFPMPKGFELPDRPGSSAFNRPPMTGDFPKSKGLPRGRRPDPIAVDADGVDSSLNPPSSASSSRWRPWNSPSSMVSPRSDYSSVSSPYQQHQDAAEQHGYTLPNWDDFDSRYDRHKSAVPAPLSPWSGASNSTTAAANYGPPRLPSPTFTSLEQSITASSPTLASFDVFNDESRQQRDKYDQPLISPVMGSFGGPKPWDRELQNPPKSPMRIEAQKAPPRPSPITVPPSKNGKTGGISAEASMAANEFQASFI